MNTLRKSALAAGIAASLLMAGCAHHDTVATTNTATTDNLGHISTDQAAATGAIPGPAKVDSDGNVYTSSAAPGSGASLNNGTNTNINIVPQKAKSTVVVTQTPIVTETPVVTETTIVETPAPAPVIVETTTVETPSMTSSVEEQTTTTTTTTKATTTRHRRMAKE